MTLSSDFNFFFVPRLSDRRGTKKILKSERQNFPQLCGLKNVDFNPAGPFISAIHTSSSFHPFASSHTPFSSFPRTFSSEFSLSDTSRVFILPFQWFCPHHSFTVTLSFPWSSSFFIRMKINTLIITTIPSSLGTTLICSFRSLSFITPYTDTLYQFSLYLLQ